MPDDDVDDFDLHCLRKFWNMLLFSSKAQLIRKVDIHHPFFGNDLEKYLGCVSYGKQSLVLPPSDAPPCCHLADLIHTMIPYAKTESIVMII